MNLLVLYMILSMLSTKFISRWTLCSLTLNLTDCNTAGLKLPVCSFLAIPGARGGSPSFFLAANVKKMALSMSCPPFWEHVKTASEYQEIKVKIGKRILIPPPPPIEFLIPLSFTFFCLHCKDFLISLPPPTFKIDFTYLMTMLLISTVTFLQYPYHREGRRKKSYTEIIINILLIIFCVYSIF